MAPRALVFALGAALSVNAQISTYTFPVPRPTPGYTYEGWEAYNFNQVCAGGVGSLASV